MLKEKTAVVCGAKDKANCRYHHPEKYVTQKHEKEVNTFFNIKPKKAGVASKDLIDNALTCNLEWDGKKPKWWKKYETDLAADKHLPTTAELVDVISSPEGPLAVVWQHESHADVDKGVTLGSGFGVKVCYLKSMKTGEDLGYIKMAYMEPETIERTFGNDEFTVFRWRERYNSGYYDFRNYDEDDAENEFNTDKLEGEALLAKYRKIWIEAKKSSHENIPPVTLLDGTKTEYVAYYNINEKHLPDDKTVIKDVKKFAKKFEKEMKEKQTFHQAPSVDFSKIEEPLRGKGYGTALYIYTARMLAKENKYLRGSGIQSDDAQVTWARFKTKFPNYVKPVELKYSGKTETYHTLDFRK